jgi:hypothetical protein
MPGCVLRVDGTKFNVDHFLSDSNLNPCIVYRKGKYRFHTSKCKESKSGMNIVVSDTEGKNIKRQINDAMSFLKKNRNELNRLKNYPGVESMILDFAFDVRVGCEDSYVLFIRLPEELIKKSSQFGIEMEFSLYPDMSVS